MIQAIWIITETGQCIFSHKYVTLDIDDQLIAGLLTAFDAFSTESGIGGVQQIAGEDNQFNYGSSGKLLVAALADKIDNSKLIEKLMTKIADLFQEKYAVHLQDVGFVDLNVFNGFEEEIDQVLKPKIYRRGVFSTLFATFVTVALTAGVLFSLLNFIQAQEAIFILFLAFIPGLFIGAIIAGKSSYGLISSTIGVIPIISLTAYYIIINAIQIAQDTGADIPYDTMIFTIVLMAEQFITIAVLSGILGGGFIDRRRLSPLSKSSKPLEVFVADVPVTTPDLGTQLQQQQYQQEVDNQQNNQTDYYAESSSLVDEQKTEWDS